MKSQNLISSCSSCTNTLSSFSKAELGHGSLSERLIDHVVVPIRKPGTYPSFSDIYHTITLSLTISKILELCLLIRYTVHLSSSVLQFGFKKNMSLLCTGVLRIMLRNISKETPPFLSAFQMLQAFVLVRHDIVLDLLLSYGFHLL